jgi:adenosine deaminase
MSAIEDFINKMPKVELHVRLEGSVRPETLLKLAKRHQVPLPAENVAGLREWYTFCDFDHFIEIYMAISSCLRTAEDSELVAREFLSGQAEQNILYSEVTFTPFNQFANNGLGFHEQMDAVNRARAWAEKELGVRMGVIVYDHQQRRPAHVQHHVDKRVHRWISYLWLGYGFDSKAGAECSKSCFAAGH